MKIRAILPCLLGAALLAAPAGAATVEEVERLLASSETAQGALALARQQAADGQLLEALASAERARFFDPKNKPARLLRAQLLCRLDDPQGAALEWDRLKKGDYKKAEWRAAKAECPALFGQGG
ncbi:MAG TPA: hypothetical protein PKD92_12750 [Novosphingobium sp.]|nr:hypothetical protein [Novosphingobium sp.]